LESQTLQQQAEPHRAPLAFRFKPWRAIAEAYVNSTPLAHALFRSAEARFVCDVPLERPVLEIGCGYGQFGSMAFDTPADMAVDSSRNRVRKAERTGRYDRVVCADACSTPFPAESFRAALAISVLEHIASPDRVLAEIFRVLQPGGVFVATIDLPHVNVYSRVLARIGLARASRLCQRLYDAAFDHVAVLPQETWECLFERAGFEILRADRILSPRAAVWYDLLLLTAWPYKIAERFGCPVVWRPWFLRRMLAARIETLIERDGPRGRCLFLLVRKPCHVED
jgi:SAM-dependent methyltransferase